MIDVTADKDCKLQLPSCRNLVLRTGAIKMNAASLFFGCKNFPHCKYMIPLQFDEKLISVNHQKLARAFENFIQTENFIYATFGVVYFNIRQAAFLDYLLRTVRFSINEQAEFGLTGAIINKSLFYHLHLIPEKEIKYYLINNFPKTYISFLTNDFVDRKFYSGIDYRNHIVDEAVFKDYCDIDTYNR